ncbi:MAG: transglutaminase-like domain-containing protein [Pyrinomonadaceae bacterium]
MWERDEARAAPAAGAGVRCEPLTRPLRFDDEEEPLPYAFRRSARDEPYLAQLRADYDLDGVVAGKETCYEKVRAVSRWTRSRWEHDGALAPARPDPISILREAARGGRFRCVEYAVVLSAALDALGIPARVVGLKAEDVETRERGAGHVVAEAYLSDEGRWVMVDPQLDVVPTLDGRPLSAVDFQRALADTADEPALDRATQAWAGRYFNWVAPYLFYFDTKFDTRFGCVQQPHSLMLVPLGAKRPRAFQGQPLRDVVYTHSVAAFYAAPV